MPRTLADVAAGDPPLEVRLRIARGLARAVAALHRRGTIHGALCPAAVLVADAGDAVALSPDGDPDPDALAGWAAPEVVRGARPTRRADAFAAAALAQLAVAGRGPFDGGDADALELRRRTLFEAPRPACLDAPGIAAEVGEAIARLLEKRPSRRGTVEELARALDAADGAAAAPSSRPSAGVAPVVLARVVGACGGAAKALAESAARVWRTGAVPAERAAGPAPGPGPGPGPGGRVAGAVNGDLGRARAASSVGARVRALVRRVPPSPLHRAALVAAPLLAGVVVFLGPSDARLARDVGRALARGELVAARATLDAAPRSADRALVEKLRGDLACARQAPQECLRRYRTALAARPELRTDEALRQNVRALLAPRETCATQRSAALLAGQLRDPEALPALRAARRSAGLFAFLCTGDALDRAIAAARASPR